MAETIPGNVIEFINYTAARLEEIKIDDARLNAELMLSEVLKSSRMELYMNFEKPLTKDEIQKFKSMLQRRLNYEPLQHILGKTNFFGYDFIVNSKVLIPRQETELLAEKVIEDVKSSSLKKVTVFEIGSGSGCLSIALAKSLQKENVEVNIFSIDISKDAVDVSNENLRLNNLDEKTIRFFVKDIFEIEKLNKNFDYIVSNPPYISQKDYENLNIEVKEFEPKISLTDDSEGLNFYEKIFMIASDKTFSGKVFCEIGFGQMNSVEKILLKNNFSKYKFYKDYSNIDRIIEAHK